MQDDENSLGLKKAFVLSILSSTLLAFSMPGSGLWPLAFFGLIPWAWASARASQRAWLVDFVFVLSFLSFTVWWIGHVSWVGAVATILVEATLMLPLGWLWRRLVRWMPATLALPIAWCVIEFLRTRYPYGGLPFSVLGFAAWEQEQLLPFASVFGVHGVSFPLAACSGFVLDLADRERRSMRMGCRAPIACLCVIVAAAFCPVWMPAASEGTQVPGPRVLAIQANIPSQAKGDFLGPKEVVQRYLTLSQKALAAHPETDLLIWPESSFLYPLSEGGGPEETIFVEEGRPFTTKHTRSSEKVLREALFKELLQGRNTSFLGNASVYVKDEQGWAPRNSALYLKPPAGERAGLYHKMHLVPGGEFVPNLGPISMLVEWFSGLEDYRGQLGVMQPGREVVVMALDGAMGRWNFGVSICYDNAYADLYREAANRGAQFHVVLSNEGWYGSSSEMNQLLAAAVFRAVETGRPFLRATNSGISALIDSRGKAIEIVRDRSGAVKHVEGFLAASMPPGRSGPTLYMSWGDMPFWGLAGLALVLALLPKEKRKLPAR